jgi:hypothetical protein
MTKVLHPIGTMAHKRHRLDDRHINQDKSPTISNRWHRKPNAGEMLIAAEKFRIPA